MENNVTLQQVIDKANTSFQKYTRPKFIASLLELLISALCIIGINLITLGLDYSRLETWEFWLKTAIETIGVFELFRAVVNARFEKTASRECVINAKSEYNTKNAKKKMDLKDFLKEYNYNNKVMAYVRKVNQKIARLERKAMRMIGGKKKELFLAKIEREKEFISEEYIKEHIDKIKVKYIVVYYSDFYDENTIVRNGVVNPRRSYNGAFNVASFNKIWAYVLGAIVLSLAVFGDTDYTATEVIANLVASSFMVITRVVMALLEADRIYDKTILANIHDKIDILTQYEEWQQTRPVQLSERQQIAEEQRKKDEIKLNEMKAICEELQRQIVA